MILKMLITLHFVIYFIITLIISCVWERQLFIGSIPYSATSTGEDATFTLSMLPFIIRVISWSGRHDKLWTFVAVSSCPDRHSNCHPKY